MNDELKQKYNNILYETNDFIYKTYPGESLITDIMNIMGKYLSEPYPILTYRYFLNGWPDCTIICYQKKDNKFIGCIVGCVEKKKVDKGYIAMLAVDETYRKQGIGKKMVSLLIDVFKNVYKVKEIYLETEIDNYAALGLYESFGFIRTKYFLKYYLNSNSAYRLKLFI